MHFSSLPYLLLTQSIPSFIFPRNKIWRRVLIVKLIIIQILVSFSLFQIFSLTPCSQTPQIDILCLTQKNKFHTHTKQRVKSWFIYVDLYDLGRRPEDCKLNRSRYFMNLIFIYIQQIYSSVYICIYISFLSMVKVIL
jgi:hypothetical protein